MTKAFTERSSKILKLIKKSSVLVLDTLFPRFCVGCGKEGMWLCSKCQDAILIVQSQVCPECNRLSPEGKYCLRCRYEIDRQIDGKTKRTKVSKKRRALEGIIVAAYYEEGPLREIIHNYKYNGVTELTEVLGEMLYNALKRNFQFEIITFVPLHPRRLAQRGYNQAELLAHNLAKKSNIECLALLKKKKQTKRQVLLTGKKRRQNLKGVFELRMKNDELRIKEKNIIIVDDVTTTGATLNECARVLKDAGAKEIWGLVVARG